jgi:hypothetical protein
MKRLLFAAAVLFSSVATATIPGEFVPVPFADESSPTSQEEIGLLTEPRHIRFGMTPLEVRSAMRGKPDVVLAPGLWVYWRFRAAVGRDQQKYDTLVVYFSENRVDCDVAQVGQPGSDRCSQIEKDSPVLPFKTSGGKHGCRPRLT